LTELHGRSSFLQLLGGSSIGKALNFGVNLLLSRVLGPAELGLFSLILSTSQTFELLSRAGVDYGLTCALTDKDNEHDEGEYQSLVNIALQIARTTTWVLLLILILWLGPGKGLLPIDIESKRYLIIIIVGIICVSESLSGLPWDILLVRGKIKIVRLRHSLFVPLKLTAALLGAWSGGIMASLLCYSAMSGVQSFWLNRQVIARKKPIANAQIQWKKVKKLLGDGLPLYISNALSAIVFLPLLADIATISGLQSVGYLRAGQIVTQVFTLIPGALSPILFIKSRTSQSSQKKQQITEQSLFLIWCVGLATLLAYITFDKQVINILFGSDFLNSLQPTRMLIYITLVDSLGQVLHTALLAKRQVKLFLIVQNSSLALSAIAGWYFIPTIGLDGFLLSKLIFAGLPALIYLTESWGNLHSKDIVVSLAIASIGAFPLCWTTSIPPMIEVALASSMIICLSLALLRFKYYLAALTD
jgi:O-antigen/teichoic acid export membrane protein